MPRRAPVGFEWLYKFRYVEYTYEFGYREFGGAHREYWTYEVNITKLLPEGERPGNLWLGYKEEAKGIMYKNLGYWKDGEERFQHDWIIMPEGKERGGWGPVQTLLAPKKTWTRGPFQHFWRKKK